MTSAELRAHLQTKIPTLWEKVQSVTEGWATRVCENLDQLDAEKIAFPKTFTDPVLGPIELFEWEVAILDSPALQRLRGVRQLGMAHYVYSGATHDRLSHVLGVVEVAQRMILALGKNAENHRKYGIDKDPHVPPVDDDDRYSIRLAALLHDVGHGPFSHASEPLIEETHGDELAILRAVLQQEFPGAGRISASEAVAVLIILSGPFGRVFGHEKFRPSVSSRAELPVRISARLLGSWKAINAGYLSQIISGTLDADKLDYMARDSYFTGLPLGLDVERLINKLEVITITETNALDDYVRQRVKGTSQGRLYELGVSLSGLTAYEQMIIGRVLLYDRVYYHHKVRCAEAMLRLLFRVAGTERGSKFSLDELLPAISDDSMLHLLGGAMSVGGVKGGKTRSHELAEKINLRRFYHRAFVFAERLLGGLKGLTEQEERNTRSILWQHVMDALGTEAALHEAAEQIRDLAGRLQKELPELAPQGEVTQDSIIVDLPEDRVIASPRGIYMRTESGELADANLYFNPAKWSEAYKNQKKCGYVFTPRRLAKPVSLASQIYFFERFGVLMTRQARHLCKLGSISQEDWNRWLDAALTAKLCSPECRDALKDEKPQLVKIRAEDIDLPEEWRTAEPDVRERLEKQFRNAFGGGFLASVRDSLLTAIRALARAMDGFERQGEFKKNQRPDEKTEFQRELAKALNYQGCMVKEGQEITGGETDLILPGELILENKVSDAVSDLSSLKPDAPWQARRYSIALNRRVFLTAIAYKPQSQAQILPLPGRISVHRLEGAPEECCYVRVIVPWGTDSPSKAKSAKA